MSITNESCRPPAWAAPIYIYIYIKKKKKKKKTTNHPRFVGEVLRVVFLSSSSHGRFGVTDYTQPWTHSDCNNMNSCRTGRRPGTSRSRDWVSAGIASIGQRQSSWISRATRRRIRRGLSARLGRFGSERMKSSLYVEEGAKEMDGWMGGGWMDGWSRS